MGLWDNVSVIIMHNVWMLTLRLNAKRKAEKFSRLVRKNVIKEKFYSDVVTLHIKVTL